MVDRTASAADPEQSAQSASASALCFWRQLGLHRCIKIAIVAALYLFVFRDELVSVIRRWCTDSSWSHGFLIPLFSLYFLNQQKTQLLTLRPKPNYLGLVALLLAIAFYIFNWISPAGWAYLRSLSMLAALGAIVLLLGGWPLVKHTWLPIFFLIFAIPLPNRLYKGLTLPMRRWAASVANALLNVVPALDARAQGVVISVVYKGQAIEPDLNVAEACSGMRLLTAFLALGVAMAYLHHRPLWQRLVLLLSTVPIAIFCNIVRVTATGFIHVFAGSEYTQGIYHDALGLAMLPLAFSLYGFLAWFMSSLFIEETQPVQPQIIVRRTRK